MGGSGGTVSDGVARRGGGAFQPVPGGSGGAGQSEAGGSGGASASGGAGGLGGGGTSGSGGASSGGSGSGGAGGSGGTSSGGSGASDSGGTSGTGGAAPGGEPPELKGIIDLHNQERRKVGVPHLVWSDTLAAVAQAWASKCIDTVAPMGLVDHNANRAVGYGGTVGENIFGTTSTPTAQEAVKSWAEEARSYDYAKNTCSLVCGRYTQVVWKATQKVGCAVSKCANLKFGGTLVCNYSPAGNVSGQRPY